MTIPFKLEMFNPITGRVITLPITEFVWGHLLEQSPDDPGECLLTQVRQAYPQAGKPHTFRLVETVVNDKA